MSIRNLLKKTCWTTAYLNLKIAEFYDMLCGGIWEHIGYVTWQIKHVMMTCLEVQMASWYMYFSLGFNSGYEPVCYGCPALAYYYLHGVVHNGRNQ
jgi:hypothetical protein